MGTYEAYKTDPELEKNGAVVDLGSRGVFLLARAGGANRKYTDLVRNLTRPYRRQLASGDLEGEIADRLTIEAFSKTIVLGWFKKGDALPGSTEDNPVVCEYDVTGPNGEPLPFSPANAKMLLTDLPDLFTDLQEFSNQASTYRAATVAAEGNV